jgi:hypothetical protein
MRVLENNYGWNPVETAPLDKDVTLEVTDGRDARQISSITQSEDSVTFRESVGPGVYSSLRTPQGVRTSKAAATPGPCEPMLVLI